MVTHDEMTFSEVISNDCSRVCLIAICNRRSNEKKGIAWRFTRQNTAGVLVSVAAALYNGFSVRHFERRQGPGN